MKHKSLLFSALCLTIIPASVAVAQEDHAHDQPYAGLESRDLKALSPDEVAALEAGQGMGFALAAELNGYPGPRHVLELRHELELTAAQESATQRIFESMQADAREQGSQLIALESELDLAFRSGTVDPQSLGDLLSRIGQVRARLRGTHLRAHLELMEHLTEHQVHRYGQLRGYGTAHQGRAGG
jgi:hypothetical protein